MPVRVQIQVVFVIAAVVAVLMLYPAAEALRAPSYVAGAEARFEVSRSANEGPGSLRDALFRALRHDGPSEIVLNTDLVRLTTPLPPLATAREISIWSASERPTVIDASALDDLPALDVRGGRVVLRGFEVIGARGNAIRVASGDPVSIRDLAIRDSGVGIVASGEFDIDVVATEFSSNRIGIELQGSGRCDVEQASFLQQVNAGVWAVGGAEFTAKSPVVGIVDSRFTGGRYGVVLANASLRLHASDISGFLDDGVLTFGGATDIAGNRVWNGHGSGIRSVNVEAGSLRDNELHENAGIGILVQGAQEATVLGNKLYRNGYGIVTVRNLGPAAVNVAENVVAAQQVDGLVTVADSPVLARNQALRNRVAGIRIYELIQSGQRFPSKPYLDANLLQGNGIDEPENDAYHVPDGPEVEEDT